MKKENLKVALAFSSGIVFGGTLGNGFLDKIPRFKFPKRSFEKPNKFTFKF